MGNKLVFFASRDLNNSTDVVDWAAVYVDQYFSSSLVALDVYRTANGFVVYQTQFGNYGDTRKIVPQAIPNFIELA